MSNIGTLPALCSAGGETPAGTPDNNREGKEHDSEEDRQTVARARKVERFLSQPFFVAEIFTGSPGKYVSLADAIDGFTQLLDGKLDDIPEQAFYLVGNLAEVVEKAEKLK